MRAGDKVRIKASGNTATVTEVATRSSGETHVWFRYDSWPKGVLGCLKEPCLEKIETKLVPAKHLSRAVNARIERMKRGLPL